MKTKGGKTVQRNEREPEVAERFHMMAIGRRIGRRLVIETGLGRPAEKYRPHAS